MIVLLVIAGFALTIAAAGALLFARAQRSRRLVNEHARRMAKAVAWRAAEDARAATDVAVQRQAEDKARIAAEVDARRRAGEAAQPAADSGALAAEEARPSAEAAALRDVEEKARVTETETRRQAEEHARLAAEAEARRAAEEARAAAEAAIQRDAEDEPKITAEAEARQRADEDARLAAEAGARAAGEARAAAKASALRDVEERVRVATEAATRRQADEDARVVDAQARSNAEEEARAPVEAQNEAEENDSRVEPDPAAAATLSRGARRRAPQYRAPTGETSARRPPSNDPTAAKPESELPPAATKNRAASIELRLLFERGGYCRVSLLPRRPQGLPEECTVSTATGSIDLIALEDEWYQDVVPNELGALLRTGFVWTDEATRQEWLLAGPRDIFVLATGTMHRGFVSCPRLVLGREHAVLCTSCRLHEVEHVLREAGCRGWMQFGEDDGAPQGWIVLSERDSAGRIRGLVPRNAVPLEEGADFLNVLRPLPEIEIAFEAGVPLGYTSWLAGQPPAIRIYGDSEHKQTVLIDGQEAASSEQGTYTAPGWDEPGTHQVWCSSASRKYSLVRLERIWSAWAAYSLPSLGGVDSSGRVAICGPLVYPSNDAESFAEGTGRLEVLNISPTNPVLIGALPGDVFVAIPRTDVHGTQCVASPSFGPVWALPAQPLHCNKNTNRILLIDGVVAPGSGVASPRHGKGARAVERWCRLILDASRKGLSVEPATPATAELWREYKRRARELRRTNR